MKGCPSLQTSHYVAGNVKHTPLAELWASSSSGLEAGRRRAKLSRMLFALALSTTLVAAPGIPVRAEQTVHLLPREQVLQPMLGAHGLQVYHGVRQVVTGSILTVLGGVFGGLGVWGLLSAIPETGSTRTLYTALGWTSLGFGIVLGAVGIPLLIVGIVKLARPSAALEVSDTGLLAVRF